MSERDDSERRRSEMVATGCFFANPIFKIKAPKKRLGKRFSVSIEGGELVWGAVCSVVVVVFILFLFFTIGGGTIPHSTFGLAVWGPVGWIVWPAMAFFFGRNLNHMSPFTSRSGEGATAWFKVTSRNVTNKFLSFIGLMPISYNPVITTMRDQEKHEPRVTMAKEYVGISLAPSAPFVKSAWDAEALRDDLRPEDRNYGDYPEQAEIIDVVPSGRAKLMSRHSLQDDVMFLEEDHKEKVHQANIRKKEEAKRRRIEMKKSGVTPDGSFWDNV